MMKDGYLNGRRSLACFAAAALCALGSIMPAAAQDTLAIRLRALDGLRFDQVRFEVPPAAPVRLVFENRDAGGMAHNVVFTQPGAREQVVRAALALGAAGEARAFVPRTDQVLWASPVLQADSTFVLRFRAPAEPGVYPYVCTFPGHGFVMYGAMYVGVTMPPLAEDERVPPAARAAAPPPEPFARPTLVRYLMPESGPASIAVALPNGQNYCWDAGACRLRYAWAGAFLDRSESLHGKGGKAMQIPARLLGDVYYRAGDVFPIRVGEDAGPPTVRFRGYRLIDGMPEFEYDVDGVRVHEHFAPAHHGGGLVRTFRVAADRPVRFVAENETGVRFTASSGSWQGGVLHLSPEQARRFVITMVPTSRSEGSK